jgi:hypothetical protein
MLTLASREVGMGAGPRLSKTYWRLLAWVAVGAFLDWAMTVAAVGFLGFHEMHPLWARYFESGQFGVPLIFKMFSVALFAIGFIVLEGLLWRQPSIRWAKPLYVAYGILSVCIVWTPVVWNSTQNVLYILGV